MNGLRRDPSSFEVCLDRGVPVASFAELLCAQVSNTGVVQVPILLESLERGRPLFLREADPEKTIVELAHSHVLPGECPNGNLERRRHYPWEIACSTSASAVSPSGETTSARAATGSSRAETS